MTARGTHLPIEAYSTNLWRRPDAAYERIANEAEFGPS